MKTVIFNAKMIGRDECAQYYIEPFIDDYLNHMSIFSAEVILREFSNAVVLSAKQFDGTNLMLLFVPNTNDPKVSAKIVNIAYRRLGRRYSHPKYFYCRGESFDYMEYFTRENEEYVFKLRQDLVDSVMDRKLTFPNVSREMRESIREGDYKALSRYEVGVCFMDVIRGVMDMPERRPSLNEFDELPFDDDEPSMEYNNGLYQSSNVEKSKRPYIASLDGKRLDAGAMFAPSVSEYDEELDDECVPCDSGETTDKKQTTRQTSLEDFQV